MYNNYKLNDNNGPTGPISYRDLKGVTCYDGIRGPTGTYGHPVRKPRQIFQLFDMESEIRKDFKRAYVCSKEGPGKTILINNLKIHAKINDDEIRHAGNCVYSSSNYKIISVLYLSNVVPVDKFDYLFLDKSNNLTFSYPILRSLVDITEEEYIQLNVKLGDYQYLVFDFTEEQENEPEEEIDLSEITIEI